MLPSIQGRGAKGSPLSDSSIHSTGACASQLHQYRVHDGAEQALHGEKCPCDDRPFHEVCPCCGDKGSDGQDGCEGVLRVLYSGLRSTH